MNCSTHPDRPAFANCSNCNAPVCMECGIKNGDSVVCQTCLSKAKSAQTGSAIPYGNAGQAAANDRIPINMQAASQAGTATSGGAGYLGAIGMGLLAAIIGAVVWDKVVYYTHWKSAIVAVGLGVAVGLAVVKGAGNNPGRALPMIGALLAAFGILLGEYLLVGDMLVLELAKEGGKAASLGGMEKLTLSLIVFPTYLVKGMHFMSWIFVAIGIYEGWKVPKRAISLLRGE